MGYAILSLVTMMFLLKGVDSCGTCDPDVPYRQPPTEFMRRGARLTRGLPTNATKCGAGTFFNRTSNQCELCPDGSFMTAIMAEKGKHIQCEKCHVANENVHEVAVEPCNKTRDTLTFCTKYYYRKQSASDQIGCIDCKRDCTPCSICGIGRYLDSPSEKQSCDNETDTICCHSDNMIVENGRCETPPPTTLGPPEQTTVQHRDTGETRSHEPTLRTTEDPTNHQRNSCETIFVNSPLVFLSFLLSLSISSFSS